MDLRRFKTIFIFVLVAINIMFFVLLNNAKNYEREERQTMTQSLSVLLAKNMIYLPQKTVLPESPEISNFYLEKMFGSNDELVTKFLGKNYTMESDGVYKSESGKLYIDGDEIKYYSVQPPYAVSDFSEENIEKLCREAMKKLGIMSDLYIFSGFNFVDEGIRAIFTVKHGDDEFFDAYVSFDISGQGITAVTARNVLSGVDVSDSGTDFFSIISILPDLAENPQLIKGTAHTIISIKPGYYIGKTSESYRNILAIPVWQIATDSGYIIYYDARNGQRIDS